ncbi:hypothetical protein SAMN05444287_0243 [Octadecabacter temperatus]|uniref:Uncharacterized protein n=1 Tax=Octadecabacter temperatus TaxID=1458307 RepID=A0A0K0Y2M0_9RHOB|nr:UPF0280 family protein [Octadecabacter temperatus]AKS45152.1 hypothetical protein OSB_05910 [Octadecabacter temperatus]SIN87217.1 hypothetical protein SAMN05444287_0243 [Octadecabacter temperatus]
MNPTANLLPDGKRLHLQHGPIDLIIGADGDRDLAFAAARRRFETILSELVTELPLLQAQLLPDGCLPSGTTAKRMDLALRPYSFENFVTRMAAVAGSVADEVLEAMCEAACLERAFVNNGGDIALHLTQGTQFTMTMAHHDGHDLGRIEVKDTDPIRGIATSGRHGRSLSLGIADSVTVLAENAAQADAAATLVANHVNLPNHPSVQRLPANDIVDASDLGNISAVVGCAALSRPDVKTALDAGATFAQTCLQRGLLVGASLQLQDQNRAIQLHNFQNIQRMPEHA